MLARPSPRLALILRARGLRHAVEGCDADARAVAGRRGNQPSYSPDASVRLPPLAAAVAPPMPVNLYADQRVAHVGDILTVNISINDKARVRQFHGSLDDLERQFRLRLAVRPAEQQRRRAYNPRPLNYKHDFNSTSSSQGNGDINRSEQIQLSVPAIVTQVLPNGNLVIKGSQEVRVNFELRAADRSPASSGPTTSRATIPSPTTASRRRASPMAGAVGSREVQQPGWGQQVYDVIKPY